MKRRGRGIACLNWKKNNNKRERSHFDLILSIFFLLLIIFSSIDVSYEPLTKYIFIDFFFFIYLYSTQFFFTSNSNNNNNNKLAIIKFVHVDKYIYNIISSSLLISNFSSIFFFFVVRRERLNYNNNIFSLSFISL